MSYLLCSHKNLNLFLNRSRKKLEPIQALNIWVWHPRSEIQDPEKSYSGARNQGSKKGTMPPLNTGIIAVILRYDGKPLKRLKFVDIHFLFFHLEELLKKKDLICVWLQIRTPSCLFHYQTHFWPTQPSVNKKPADNVPLLTSSMAARMSSLVYCLYRFHSSFPFGPDT